MRDEEQKVMLFDMRSVLETPEAAKIFLATFNQNSLGYEVPDPTDMDNDEAIDCASDILHMVMDDMNLVHHLRGVNKLH